MKVKPLQQLARKVRFQLLCLLWALDTALSYVLLQITSKINTNLDMASVLEDSNEKEEEEKNLDLSIF